MGLDMYLYARRYLYKLEDVKITKAIREASSIPDNFEVKEIKIEAGYWRKANQIHRWFVFNVQNEEDDCGYYSVDRKDLTDLRDLCQRVIEDHDLAPSELPTTAGFFFGSTEYDDWYYQELQDTIEILDKALTLSEDWDFEYHSSW